MNIIEKLKEKVMRKKGKKEKHQKTKNFSLIIKPSLEAIGHQRTCK